MPFAIGWFLDGEMKRTAFCLIYDAIFRIARLNVRSMIPNACWKIPLTPLRGWNRWNERSIPLVNHTRIRFECEFFICRSIDNFAINLTIHLFFAVVSRMKIFDRSKILRSILNVFLPVKCDRDMKIYSTNHIKWYIYHMLQEHCIFYIYFTYKLIFLYDKGSRYVLHIFYL